MSNFGAIFLGMAKKEGGVTAVGWFPSPFSNAYARYSWNNNGDFDALGTPAGGVQFDSPPWESNSVQAVTVTRVALYSLHRQCPGPSENKFSRYVLDSEGC